MLDCVPCVAQFNWFGIQDNSADSYLLDYISMIHRLRQLSPAPKIVVLTLVPLYPPFPYDMNSTVINDMLSGAGGLLFQLAALEADAIIDVHAAFVEAGFGANITCDGCHPVDKGYEFLASVLATGIHDLVGDDTPLPPLDSVRKQYHTQAFREMVSSVNQHARRPSSLPEVKLATRSS